MEIAVLESSRVLGPADLAFLVRAVNIQMERDYGPAFMNEPWPVRSYASLQPLKPGTFWPMALMDFIGQPGALGFHTEDAGLVYGRVLASEDHLDGTTLSHESLEMRGDPTCETWIPMGDGRSVAYELADPCEADSYAIAVTIGDETRAIRVSDFVLPAWFVPGAPGPYTFLDTVDAPFGLSRNGGGYRLIRDAHGNVSSDFGRHGVTSAAIAKMARKIADPRSRTARRGLR